jgi:hypothetical protein
MGRSEVRDFMNASTSRLIVLLFLCLFAMDNVKAMSIENDYFKVDVLSQLQLLQ